MGGGGGVPGKPAPASLQGLPPPQSRGLVGGDRPEVAEILSHPTLKGAVDVGVPGGGAEVGICKAEQRRGRRDLGYGSAGGDPGVRHGVAR